MAMNSVMSVRKVPDAQVDHRKPAPERPEALEDQLGVSAMRRRAQAHGHLLHYDRHAKRERDKRNEESDAKLCARSSVGEHAGPVVLSQHDQNPRPHQQPQQTGPGEKAALGARRRHPDAIVRTIHVFVGDDDDFVALQAGASLRRWRL